ncbi:MAG: aldehyde dehydrogenase family protein [Candidatus Bathyarchaeia archaeon]|jgi:1-pyrroline-5-carboxylate dehydrogenase
MAKAAHPKITYVTLSADESIHPKYEDALRRFDKELGRHYPMYIGADEVWSESGEFEHHSPIDTSITVGRFQVGKQNHAKLAIEAAKAAFPQWSEKSWQERIKIMNKAADLIDERKFDIAVAITYEVGKNRLEALAECWEAIDAIKFYSKTTEKNNGYAENMDSGGPGEQCSVVSKPFGVWPVISPFNFPFMLANGMALGALITGNAVILKPTSEAPLAGLMLYKVFKDAGIPAGAINYVTGPGPNFEKEFVSNRDVAGIAFTGSRDVGMRLYREFLTEQPYPKPILLEMGSKNPVIVTSSADIGKAVEGTVRAAFGYGGQKCSATSRIYVQSSIRNKFLKVLRERVDKIVVGDPREKAVFIGPVIKKDVLTKFTAALAEAKKAGGKVLTGGKIIKAGKFRRGFYLSPTIIIGLPATHRLFRDELFMPFAVVDEFKTIEEAIAKANNTEYGLTAGIFSEDREEIRNFMNRVQFGVLYSNRSGGATTGSWPGSQSFTGWNASGATGRGVGGPHYLLNFLRDQSQTIVS